MITGTIHTSIIMIPGSMIHTIPGTDVITMIRIITVITTILHIPTMPYRHRLQVMEG